MVEFLGNFLRQDTKSQGGTEPMPTARVLN
jgi:hypothetical protein